MAKCKFCRAEVPKEELFSHWNTMHREEMQAIRYKPKHKKLQAISEPVANVSGDVAVVEYPDTTLETAKKEKPLKKEGAPGKVQKEEAQLKGRFISQAIDLPGDLLVFYWLAKAAFPEYDATEGEWIADCINQFYAEHSEELGLDKLFDKTFQVVPVEVPAGGEK